MADRWTTVTAVATSLTAMSVGVAAWGIVRDAEHKRVDRALEILEKATKGDTTEPERTKLLEAFRGRWEPDIKQPLSREDALAFWKVAPNPSEKSEANDRYKVARDHLNRLATIAFAYVHGAADRKLLEQANCVYLVRSNYYFQHVIKVFGEELGTSQAWQVIPQAADQMKKAYGPLCRVNLSQRPD